MADVEGQVRDEELDAEREARRRIALAQIRQFPDVALRMQAREVESFDDELRGLVDRMKRLMEEARGIGLAGPQVGVLQRVFVFQPNEDDVVAVVNPDVVEHGKETDVAEEGCLSIQGILVPVERPTTISLVGRNERGEEVRYELDDIYARAAQHEMDHLDGVLILDRTTPEARRDALAVLRPRLVLSS